MRLAGPRRHLFPNDILYWQSVGPGGKHDRVPHKHVAHFVDVSATDYTLVGTSACCVSVPLHACFHLVGHYSSNEKCSASQPSFFEKESNRFHQGLDNYTECLQSHRQLRVSTFPPMRIPKAFVQLVTSEFWTISRNVRT